jgi:outer membrane PBP1 activator LpoA protein
LFERQRLDPELQGDDVVLNPAMRDSRLFALGLDAYRLMPWLPALSSAQGLSINGATGRLTIDPEGVVHRHDLVWVRFEEGIANPLAGAFQELQPVTTGEESSEPE